MEGTHYKWGTEVENKIFHGRPSRRLFDPFNGDQVLFLINFYGSLSDRFTLQEGKKIEYEITYHLPNDIKSEVSAFNWIRNVMTSRETNR
jgi:hypothetical protein